MVQFNELRIGNLVHVGNGIYERVLEILCDSITTETKQGIFDFEGIPLTPEMLKKAGYRFVYLAGGYANENHFIELTETGCIFHPFCTSDDSCFLIIEFLHQLQNAEFMFTGEELQLDL